MQGLLRRLGVRSPSQAARALSSSSSASVQYASKRVLRETVGSSADWNHFAMRNKLPGTVNLGQGFCDFVPDQVSRLLQDGLSATLANNALNQYSESRGLPSLRNSLSNFMNVKYDFNISADDVCVLPSATAALFAAVQAVVNPGDEVVIFEPFFPWYPAIVRAAGGVPVFVTLDPLNNFEIPKLDVLSHAFSDRTKMCIVNTPHNPTGRVARRDELERVAELCVAHDVVCLSDEVYESCIFRQAAGCLQHIPFSLLPGMAERTISVGSASKLLSVTGWRVGWAISHSPFLLDITATMHSFNTFCAPTPLQHATAFAIDGLLEKHLNESQDKSLDISGVADTFKRNAEKLTEVLQKQCGLDVYPCESGYFVIADVKSTGSASHHDFKVLTAFSIMHTPRNLVMRSLWLTTGMTGLEFCDRMLNSDARVIAFPMSLFYDSVGKELNSMVRFSICKSEDYIDTALAELSKIPILDWCQRHSSK